VQQEHTVPALPIAALGLAAMPAVLATPVLVAVVEYACILHIAALAPEAGLSVGTAVTIEHTAPTPVGLTVTVATELVDVRGRLLTFAFTAHDGIDAIGSGRHTRAIISRARLEDRLAEKRLRTG
jgi:fluoroacetyl-CoA thioesterase